MGFGLRGALANLLALSEFIMLLLTYQKVFMLRPSIGCSLTENFVNFSTPRPDGRRADAITFPLPPACSFPRPQLLPSCFPTTSCPAAPRKKISTPSTFPRTSISSRSSRELRRRPPSSTSCGRCPSTGACQICNRSGQTAARHAHQG